jgi:hypothetical protein
MQMVIEHSEGEDIDEIDRCELFETLNNPFFSVGVIFAGSRVYSAKVGALDTAVIEVCKAALVGWKDIITKGTGHGAPPCSVSDRAARAGAGRYEDKKDHSILCVGRLLQAVAGPMGCEPTGFGWSATVEVCSVRVTRLVTDQEKSEKFSTRHLVPGTSRVDEICQHFDSGFSTGAWHRVGGGWFASIRARSKQVRGTRFGTGFAEKAAEETIHSFKQSVRSV